MNIRTVTMEDLHIETSVQGITLGTRPDVVTITPAEAEQVTHLLSIAASMRSLKAIPPFIQSSPFRIKFLKNAALTKGPELVLSREGQAGNGLAFKFAEIDLLIRATNVGVQMYKDAQIHRGEPSVVMGAVANEVHDPGFDGLT